VFAEVNRLLRLSIRHWSEVDHCFILMALGATHSIGS